MKEFRLLKGTFFFLASYLIFDTFYTLVVLKPTYSYNERRLLSMEDFPEIIICPEPPLDIEALKLRGYAAPEEYYKGMNHGWIGNGTEDVKKVSHDISTLKSMADCGNQSTLWFDGIGSSRSSVDVPVKYKLTRALSPYHVCCKVIPPNVSQSHPVTLFNFYYSKVTLVDAYKVFLTDQLTASMFDQYKSSVMLGNEIVSSDTGATIYKVKIMEYDHLQNDPKYSCYDYKVRGEYANCIENEIVEESLKYLNCTPPWMTNNEDLWCRENYKLNSNTLTYANFWKFITQIGMIDAKPKKCLRPCKIKTYEIQKIGVRKWNEKKGLSIWFENEVYLTKSSWQNDAITIISNIGGIIGISKNFLWLVIMVTSSFGALISFLKLGKINETGHSYLC